MNIAFDWLKDWVKTDKSAQEVSDELSVKGLEVEHLEKWSKYTADFENLVVAEVTKKWKHPNADKLNLTLVNTGTEILQVVCGAPNVAEGQKVVLAKIGCTITLSNGEQFAIKKSKIRGEESNGMLCAEDEIGLGKGHDGIILLPQDSVVGTSLSKLYDNVQTEVLEIGLTANRGDAASHLGTARDVAALYETSVEDFPKEYHVQNNAAVKVNIADLKACSSYIAIEMDIENGASPEWMQNRLKSIGIEPKNAAVDITNYILHDMGQPLHAFDAEKIGRSISVRRAAPGEELTTLEDKNIKLKPENLIIADENSPLALAGVMGGKNSAIDEHSKKIVLECAHFNAAVVRKTAKSHFISTDSSYRFERGVDAKLGLHALTKTLDLFEKYANGKVTGSFAAKGDSIPERSIEISPVYINKMAGADIPVDRIKQILLSLGFDISDNGTSWTVAVPSWRTDCLHAVDIVEEVLRIYGFDNIPMPDQLKLSMPIFTGAQKRKYENKIREYLAAQGFMEISTNSLVSAADFDPSEKEQLVEISNPLSTDMGVMRLTLQPSMLKTMAYNQNRQNNYTHFFELGNTYKKSGSDTTEDQHLLIASMGKQTHPGWEEAQRDSDSYFIKSNVQRLLDSIGKPWKEKYILLGKSSTEENKKYGLEQNVYWAQLNIAKLLSTKTKGVKVKSTPKFPSVARDLSLVVQKSNPFSQWKKVMKQAGPLLKTYHVFDIYEGKPLAAGEQSIAISFIFQHESKTLQNEEVDAIMNTLIEKFEKAGAIIRK